MKIYLVRHGETDWNAERRIQGQSDSRLNENGRQQAAELAPWAEGKNFCALYCSSNLRTCQTAEILTQNIDKTLHKRDGLREISLGPWEQQLWSDIEASGSEQCANFRQFPHLFSLEGAETFEELRQRGVNDLKAIVAEQEPDAARLLVVSHGALIAATLSGLASVELSRLWENPPLHNCSVSEIQVAPDGSLEVLTVGGTPLQQTGWFAK